eukprot:TRINITY_DN4628_c1_g1_i1.p1 TRINITY_DN4628_c1_g1~~TRINITY_DN4628_c1_g1_i1.p1  ORF type:complete len:458 (-),score=96.80 TRINITY_DN4628_c1_g1_i1:113-1486(-)
MAPVQASDGGSGGPSAGKTILFDQVKKEHAHLSSGFKQLNRRLRGVHKTIANKDPITLSTLKQANLCVFGAPTEKFSTSEFAALKSYLGQGGNLLFLMSEHGESGLGTNVNYFTEELGIDSNTDSVVRTVYYKYLHPKEVCINTGIVNRALVKAAGKKVNEQAKDDANASTLTYVYPYGCTLKVQAPAVPILSSGHISYPLNRPVGACYEDPKSKGRLVVLGSYHIFADSWLDKEENAKLQNVVFQWLMGDFELNKLDAAEPDLSDMHFVPDTAALAERVRCCLQESEALPKDFSTLFNDSLFKFDTNLIPEAITLYEELDVKHEPLTLIPPNFETPLPPLHPATFPPSLREPPPPALDLFDLDDEFASEQVRLAHLTNKCQSNSDLDYFVREAGEILGVSSKLKEGKKSSKHIIEYIFKQVVHFKKLNQENPPEHSMDGTESARSGGNSSRRVNFQ